MSGSPGILHFRDNFLIGDNFVVCKAVIKTLPGNGIIMLIRLGEQRAGGSFLVAQHKQLHNAICV